MSPRRPRTRPRNPRRENPVGFHEAAEGIIEAAGREDYDGVMSALDETLDTCTSCHAEYRQKIVTDEVWSRKTSMDAAGEGIRQMHRGGGER